MNDEIMQEVRKAKEIVARKISGEGFGNYLCYFKAVQAENKKKGFIYISSPEQIQREKRDIDENW
jgi:hypothetical protein